VLAQQIAALEMIDVTAAWMRKSTFCKVCTIERIGDCGGMGGLQEKAASFSSAALETTPGPRGSVPVCWKVDDHMTSHCCYWRANGLSVLHVLWYLQSVYDHLGLLEHIR